MPDMSANRKTPRSTYAIARLADDERKNLRKSAKRLKLSVSELIRLRLESDLKKAA